jgi:hypothetical protein
VGIKEYDVISFGPNFSSLTGTALLSKKFKVLYVEDVDDSIYEKIICKTCRYDVRYGVIRDIIEELGIGTIETYDMEYVDKIFIGGSSLNRKSGWDNYRNQLIDLFPDERDCLAVYFDLIRILSDEWKIILNNKVNGNWMQVKNSYKYKDVKYADYLNKNFSDQLLIDILSADVPYSDISLCSMAGFCIQIFESSRINVPGFMRSLKDSIAVNDGTVVSISGKCAIVDPSTGLLRIGDETYKADYVILNGYDKSVDLRGKYKLRLSSMFIEFCLVDGFDSEIDRQNKIFIDDKIIERLKKTENGETDEFVSYSLIISPDETRTKDRQVLVELTMPPGSDGEIVLNAVDSVLDDIALKFSIDGKYLKDIVLKKEKIFDDYPLFYKGIYSAWAFSPEESRANPLKLDKNNSNLFYSNDWGNAFFAYGKLIANTISEKR